MNATARSMLAVIVLASSIADLTAQCCAGDILPSTLISAWCGGDISDDEINPRLGAKSRDGDFAGGFAENTSTTPIYY